MRYTRIWRGYSESIDVIFDENHGQIFSCGMLKVPIRSTNYTVLQKLGVFACVTETSLCIFTLNPKFDIFSIELKKLTNDMPKQLMLSEKKSSVREESELPSNSTSMLKKRTMSSVSNHRMQSTVSEKVIPTFAWRPNTDPNATPVVSLFLFFAFRIHIYCFKKSICWEFCHSFLKKKSNSCFLIFCIDIRRSKFAPGRVHISYIGLFFFDYQISTMVQN